jgi:hypothetical protein
VAFFIFSIPVARRISAGDPMKTPTCRALLFSWLLLVVCISAMQLLGHVGIVIVILILPAWQGIRGGHDQEIATWLFRGPGIAPVLAAIYYILVFIAVASVIANGHRLDHVPLAAFIIVLMFPVFVAMAVADRGVCSRR